jgi:hypothetical protein
MLNLSATASSLQKKKRKENGRKKERAVKENAQGSSWIT